MSAAHLDPQPPAVSRRRGPLRSAVGWLQADHLRRSPLPITALAVGLAQLGHAQQWPAAYGIPLTVAAGVGAYARYHDLPGTFRPAGAATAAIAAGGWMSAAVEFGPLAGPYALMGWLGTAAAGLVYWAYRRDPAIRQAIAWQQARTAWHTRAPRYGLAGSHLLQWRETRLGEQMLIDTIGTRQRASALVGADLEERIAEQEGLRTSRVKTRVGEIAGRMIVSIRHKDPWAQPLPHPLLDPTPEIVLPPVADAREPRIVGMDPETGRALQVSLWDEEGAKRVSIVSKPGGGKTTLLNALLERESAADNSFPIGINVSKAKEMRRWRPALGASACGRDERVRALRILEMVGHVIDYRGGLDDAQDATVEPTRDVPLIPVFLDEMDTLLEPTDQLGMATRKAVKDLANRGRSEGVALVMAGTRGTAAYMGGGNIRTMIDYSVIGKVNRRSETEHAAGELGLVLPDMTRYGEGHAGVLLVADVSAARWSGGRGWKLDKLSDIDGFAARRRPTPLEPGLMAYLTTRMGAELLADLLNPAPTPGRHPHPTTTTTAPVSGGGASSRAAARALAHAHLSQAAPVDTRLAPGQRRALTIERRRQAAEQTHMSSETRAVILRLAAGPDGTTTRRIEEAMETDLGHERGLSRSGAWRCLDALRLEGVVELRGAGRGARWHLTTPPPPTPGDDVAREAEPADPLKNPPTSTAETPADGHQE